MGDVDMSTMYAIELIGVEMALELGQKGWHRIPGRTTEQDGVEENGEKVEKTDRIIRQADTTVL